MDDRASGRGSTFVTERSLVLLRHAKSDWSGHPPDRERPLAERGRRQAPVAGRWLAENVGVPDLVVLSPAARVRSTWDLVAAELESTAPVRVDDRVYAGSAEGLLAVVRDLSEDLDTVVMVGHNPGLEDLVIRLTGEQVVMKTSMIAVIRLPDGWATAGHPRAKLMAAGRPPDTSRTKEGNT